MSGAACIAEGGGMSRALARMGTPRIAGAAR